MTSVKESIARTTKIVFVDKVPKDNTSSSFFVASLSKKCRKSWGNGTLAGTFTKWRKWVCPPLCHHARSCIITRHLSIIESPTTFPATKADGTLGSCYASTNPSQILWPKWHQVREKFMNPRVLRRLRHSGSFRVGWLKSVAWHQADRFWSEDHTLMAYLSSALENPLRDPKSINRFSNCFRRLSSVGCHGCKLSSLQSFDSLTPKNFAGLRLVWSIWRSLPETQIGYNTWMSQNRWPLKTCNFQVLESTNHIGFACSFIWRHTHTGTWKCRTDFVCWKDPTWMLEVMFLCSSSGRMTSNCWLG